MRVFGSMEYGYIHRVLCTNFLCMRHTSLVFIAAIVISMSSMVALPSPVAAAPSEQEQLAALVSQVETLTRLFEILKRNFVKPARAVAACADGIDNDHDGAIDYPADTGCYSADDSDEVYYATGSYSSCNASLVSLLGTGCHYMYTDTSARSVYCDGPMTKSAKDGDTATTAGCSSSGSPSTTTTTTTTTTSTATGQGGLSASASGSSVTLSWTDFYTGETGYDIERRISGSSEWTKISTISPLVGSSGWYQNNGVPVGTYEYRVRACYTGGCADSGTVTVTTTAATTQTTTTTTTTTTTASTGGLAGSVSGSDIVLNWNDFFQGEDEYQVDRRIGTGAWAKIGAVSFLAGTSGTYKDVAPPSGTYEYRVRPCTRTSGCTGESNYARVTIGGTSTSTTAPTTAIPAPVISGVAAGAITANSATINWTTDIQSNSRVEYGVGTIRVQYRTARLRRVTRSILAGLPLQPPMSTMSFPKIRTIIARHFQIKSSPHYKVAAVPHLYSRHPRAFPRAWKPMV